METAAFIVLFVALAASAFASRRVFLFICGAVLPWVTPRLELGIGLDWYKIVGPLALIAAALIRSRAPARRNDTRIAYIVVYSIIVTTAWAFFEYAYLQRYLFAQLLGLGSGQTIFKMPVQLFSFLAQASCILIVLRWAQDESDRITAIKGAFFGGLSSILFGFFLILTTGSGALNVDETAKTNLGETSLTRLGGLSGEPKMLGACLVTLILFLLAEMSRRGSKVSLPRLLGLSLLLAGLFATLSTSAWVALGVGMAIQLAVSVLQGGSGRSLMIGLALIALMAGLITTPLGKGAIQVRMVNRLSGEKSEVDNQKDMYVFDAYSDKPEFILTGFGLGGTDLEAMNYVTEDEWQYHRTPSPGTTGARIIGDLGVIGFAIFALTVFGWARILFKAKGASTAGFIVGGFTAALLSSPIGLSLYLFLAGALLASQRSSTSDVR